MHKKPRQDPHELTEEQAATRIEICRQLLENPQDDEFWKCIITSDEKWVYLVNRDRSRRWVKREENSSPVPRFNRFDKKVMCVWWNVDGIVHFELVPNGKAVNADLYSEQLKRVYDVLKQRYPFLIDQRRVFLQHDNALLTVDDSQKRQSTNWMVCMFSHTRHTVQISLRQTSAYFDLCSTSYVVEDLKLSTRSVRHVKNSSPRSLLNGIETRYNSLQNVGGR